MDGLDVNSPLSFLLTLFVSQLKESVRRFCADELAPYAAEIDRNNGWDKLRVGLGQRF